MILTAKNGWTAGQFTIFRFLLGCYLIVHFLQLISWAPEVFSAQGMLSNAALSPFYNVFPNVFAIYDNPLFIQGVLIVSVAAAICFASGYYPRICAFLMWYILACLFMRNPLIANPSLPYTGWMLLAFCCIPPIKYQYGDKNGYCRTNSLLPHGLFWQLHILIVVTLNS